MNQLRKGIAVGTDDYSKVIYDELNIEICTHQISDKKINYNDVHYKTLSQMTLDNKEVIEAVCASNLNIYDNI